MMIFPAVDIKGGRCVRLYQGKADAETVYDEVPVNAALKWQGKGAQYLHLVDLDGAFQGSPVQIHIVKDIVKQLNIPIELGGGIRTLNDLEVVFNAGVHRAILGTSAYKSVDFLEKALDLYSDQIAVALDARDGKLVAKGWVEDTGKDVLDFSKELENLGVKTVIYTDVKCDGTLKGPNYDALERLIDNTSMNVIASGGISCKEDVVRLKEMKNPQLEGVIVGQALYTGNVKLEEII
ncbi:MAG: 1-(5-phosphoribosyl)-5-[(5-phosphoribosylamino)methylideneamino]imidazole-4-carboxamide isomerase [Candidatus Theseobacter exili]|nr:1-(5-phosphoribosyl)-5-[(5-phosphoribosylamino)methylideneamino]imidazole-4-carboxamide isomerase [Candidatus Theseobacter exili]